MCGRFILVSSGKNLAEHFGLTEEPELSPRYNIAPTQEVEAIRMDVNGRRLEMLKWGLVPFWAKDLSIGPRLINARCETLSEKPAFRGAFKSRRCLIPANGFYEWMKSQAKKQPYLIQLTDGGLFAFAGLWERWESTDRVVLESCTIVTTDANELLKSIHSRMPVILERADYALWLDPKTVKEDLLQPLLRPYPSGEMVCRPVSVNVNKVTYDGPDCIESLLQPEFDTLSS